VADEADHWHSGLDWRACYSSGDCSRFSLDSLFGFVLAGFLTGIENTYRYKSSRCIELEKF
jgi:hypothetical protein